MTFTDGYTLPTDVLWLVVERAFAKHSRKAGMRLFGTSLWKVIESLWLVKYSSKFVFIDGRSWNSECPGLWYALVFELASWLDQVHWHRVRHHLQSFGKFAEISRKVSIRWRLDELKIKYSLKFYFLQTLIFTGFIIH